MLNKVILIGRLGKDPEVRYMPNGEAVCNFSVATSESWKDQSGQRVERTEWHNITMYRRLAEIAGQYLKKGSQVYLEGKIQSRKYQGKDGIERTAYDIIVNEMKMLGGGNDGQQAQSAQAETPTPPRRQAAPATPVEDIDDDIPF
ncbi:MAG: single-stranded DNA-binding protein [Neisseria sp.]|nr:single-stranded DNA-binding protein [Neisseria sp.]